MQYILGLPHEYGFGSRTSAFTIAHAFSKNLKNKTAIITGANSGLGFTTTCALVENGCHVIMACRDDFKGKTAFNKIRGKYPNAKLTLMKCDLSDISSVEAFAQTIISENIPVNILINNGAIAFTSPQASKQGLELQFGANYLSHYALTLLLLPVLHKNGTTEQPSRIIDAGSITETWSTIRSRPNWNEIAYFHKSPNYSPLLAYSYSKLAMILHTRFTSKRILEQNLNCTINALHPGQIFDTALWRQYIDNNHWFIKTVLTLTRGTIYKKLETGSADHVLLACHPDVANVSGQYFEDCGVMKPSYNACDDTLASELETLSKQLYQVASK